MTIDLDALEKLADEATPGPWVAADWDDDFGDNLLTIEASEPEVLHEGQSSIWPDGIRKIRVAETIEGQRPTEDAAFIAAANPATIKALIDELKEARGLLAMVSAQARVGYGDKPVLKSKRINLPAVLWHQVNAFLGGSRCNAQVDAEELKEARRLMKPFAVYYEINDLDARAADDAIEVPVGDLRLVRAFLARNGKGEG